MITAQQITNIDRVLTRKPSHTPRRNSNNLPFDAIVVAQLRPLRHAQSRQRTPNVAESKKAKSVSFHYRVNLVNLVNPVPVI
jgi:hypothetical protein